MFSLQTPFPIMVVFHGINAKYYFILKTLKLQCCNLCLTKALTLSGSYRKSIRISDTSKVPNYPDIGYRIYPDWTQYYVASTMSLYNDVMQHHSTLTLAFIT